MEDYKVLKNKKYTGHLSVFQCFIYLFIAFLTVWRVFLAGFITTLSRGTAEARTLEEHQILKLPITGSAIYNKTLTTRG